MKVHQMKLNSPHFENVVAGRKKYELRIFDSKRQEILLGDQIQFTKKNSSENTTKTVARMMLFDTFLDALEAVNFKLILPNENSVTEGVNFYESIPHNTFGNYADAAKEFGIVMIELA